MIKSSNNKLKQHFGLMEDLENFPQVCTEEREHSLLTSFQDKIQMQATQKEKIGSGGIFGLIVYF